MNLNHAQTVEKLSKKVREQALRLSKQEEYIKLCEKRIRDFYPSHQFPVLPEHIGVVSVPSQQQIAVYQARIKELTEALQGVPQKNQ